MNNYQMFRKIQERDNIIKKYFNDTKEDLIDLVIEKDNIIENLQSKIDKAIKYYETHQQECVIGRNKDDKLIKDYYLPAQCSKKLYEFLKEDK